MLPLGGSCGVRCRECGRYIPRTWRPVVADEWGNRHQSSLVGGAGGFTINEVSVEGVSYVLLPSPLESVLA